VSDPVVVHPGDPCGECHYCARERFNLCINPHHGIGYTRPGGYAQYLAASASQVVPLPDKSWLKYAALSEPFGVAMHGVNRGELKAGESVLIAGGGPIGLLTLLSARHKGAGTIVLSEITAGRRGLAKQLGADVVVDPAAGTLADVVREHTDGLGADLAIECVGTPKPMADCIAGIRKGGRVVVAGAFDRPYRVDLLQLGAGADDQYTSAPRRKAGRVVQLISSGKVRRSPVVRPWWGLDACGRLPGGGPQLGRKAQAVPR
jgi:threonine dehydrogenase-like Zn-dependent dehydrogenase